MERLKIKVQPLFILYVFLCVYFGWYNDIFYYIVVLTLHEYGHYLMTKYLGYSVDGMVFSVYGSSLKTNNSYKPRDEILIALAGPMVNVILIVCTMALWWIFPSIYLFTEAFVMCNIIVLIFNLLPIYPLDGGRVLLASLSKKINRNKLEKISSRVCIILGILVLALFIYSIFTIINYNLLFVGLFMVLNSTLSSRCNYQNTINALSKKYTKPVEVKVFKVKDLERSQLVKYLSPHYYTIFEVEKRDGILRVEEKDLFN